MPFIVDTDPPFCFIYNIGELVKAAVVEEMKRSLDRGDEEVQACSYSSPVLQQNLLFPLYCYYCTVHPSEPQQDNTSR